MTAVGDKVTEEELKTEDGLAKYRSMACWATENGKLITKTEGGYVISDPPEPSTDELAERARNRRDILLTECDYLMLPDYPLSAEARVKWEAYRQALRDIPAQAGFPQSIVYPEKPKEV